MKTNSAILAFLFSLLITSTYSQLTFINQYSTDITQAYATDEVNGLIVSVTSTTGNYQWLMLDALVMTNSIASYFITPLTATGEIDYGLHQAPSLSCTFPTGYYSGGSSPLQTLLGTQDDSCTTDLFSMYYPSVPGLAQTTSPVVFTVSKTYQWDVNNYNLAQYELNNYGKIYYV